jgi:MoaA/NifB/PqqE/SkfB family radical SAM enzyme
MWRRRVRQAVSAVCPIWAKVRLLEVVDRTVGRGRYASVFHPFSPLEYNRQVTTELEARRFLPTKALVQVSQKCNLKCRMCATGEWRENKGLMEPSLFNHVISELKNSGVGVVTIGGAQGEPFLHPCLLDLLETAVEAGLKINLTTNGTALSDAMIDQIAEIGVSNIQFSFGGWDKDSYESIYRGADFDVTARNLQRLTKRFHKSSLAPTLKVNSVVMSDIGEHVGKTQGFLRSLGLRPSEMRFVLPMNLAGVHHVGTFHEKRGIYSHREIDSAPLVVCAILSEWVGIYYDGRVTACGCVDHSGALEIGDISRDSLLTMRNSSKFQGMIRKFLSEDIGDMPLCSQCDRPYGRQGRLNVTLTLFGPDFHVE